MSGRYVPSIFHPAAFAVCILEVAIQHLLDGKMIDIIVISVPPLHDFLYSIRGESPTGPTAALVSHLVTSFFPDPFGPVEVVGIVITELTTTSVMAPFTLDMFWKRGFRGFTAFGIALLLLDTLSFFLLFG